MRVIKIMVFIVRFFGKMESAIQYAEEYLEAREIKKKLAEEKAIINGQSIPLENEKRQS